MWQNINCKGQLLDLSQPTVMGILNVTPDSFYDGGSWLNKNALLFQAEKLLLEGAKILDIGGMSSRPGSLAIPLEEELQAVLPAIEIIHKEFPKAILSVDTYRSIVAKDAVEHGASMVNDISAGNMDKNMLATVADLNIPYVIMHMQNAPQNMQKNPSYQNIILNILDFFIKKIEQTRLFGIKDVILDVGFGFGKSLHDNYRLLRNLSIFLNLNQPILTGISRKSMIWKALNSSPNYALNGTTALHMVALEEGSHILRVHDAKQALETIKLWQLLNNTKQVLYETC